jgi:hypothetical protein
MLIFREAAPERLQTTSTEGRRRSLDRWNAWLDSLAAQGKLQHGHPLESTGRVVSAAGVARAVDGPFAEAKELVGGYILVTASSLDEATAIAEQCPRLGEGLLVEVRPVAQACSLARSLGMRTMREPIPT